MVCPAFAFLSDCYPFSNNIAAMAAYGKSTIAAAHTHWRSVGLNAATGVDAACITGLLAVVMMSLPRAHTGATKRRTGMRDVVLRTGVVVRNQGVRHRSGPTCKQAATLRCKALTLGGRQQRRQWMQGQADTDRTAIAGVGTSQPDDGCRQ